jgi:hypothetical protein
MVVASKHPVAFGEGNKASHDPGEVVDLVGEMSRSLKDPQALAHGGSVGGPHPSL